MNSTLTPKPSDDPHDVVVVAPDAVRVAPDVVQVVPGDEEISNLLRAAARHHSDPQGHTASGSNAAPPVRPVDTTFRPAAVNEVLGSGHRRSVGRRAVRAFAALVLAGCIGGAAIAWQTFGYAGKKMILKWTPQFIMTSLPLDKWGLAAQPAAPAAEPDAAAPQSAPLVQTAAEGVAPAAAVPPVDSARSLQSMSRDLTNVSQEVELLKAGIAELKASQQQMARDLAKASDNKAPDQNARARISALPPRPPVARPHKPVPPYPPTPAAAAPASPLGAAPQAAAPYVPRQAEPLPPAQAQLPPEPGFTSAPRPPMPVQ